MMNTVEMSSRGNKSEKNIDLAWLNTKDLLPHPIAQRQFVESHANKLAKEFDWNKYDPICVSYRDGRYWVIRGQHRLYAIKKNNKGRDCTIQCRVFYGMTLLDEAEYFLEGKGFVEKPISTADRYKVLNNIGDDTISGMVRGAEAAGWIVDFKRGQVPGKIVAIVALKACYTALEYPQYVEMLRAIKAAWGDDVEATSQLLLKGMALFYKTYWGKFKTSELVRKLSKVSPREILRDARGSDTHRGGSKGINTGRPYARAILRVYNNRRLNSRLEDIL